MKKKLLLVIAIFIAICNIGISQNIAVNTTGTAAAAANMFEVTQPAGAASNSVGIFVTNLSTAANAYAIWAAATAAATNKYAIVVPSGGGNVGIGTTTPGYPLELVSSSNLLAKFRGSGANHTQVMIDAVSGWNSNLTLMNGGTPEWYLGNRASDNRFSWINAGGSTEAMTILQGGSVGIGIINPARLLHLQGNNAVMRIDRDADSPAILFTRTLGGSFSTIWKTFSMGTSATGVNNGTFDISDLGSAVSGAGTPRITIDNVGYVGISASAPSARLQVGTTSSDGRANGIQLGDAASYKYNIYQQTVVSGSIQNSMVIDANGDVDLRQTLGTNNGSGHIVFMTGAGTAIGGTGVSTEKMRINYLGNVGIGTPTPAAHLEVIDAISGANSLTVSKNFNGIPNTNAAFIGGTDAAYAATGIYVDQKNAVGFPSATSYIFNVVNNGVSSFVVNGFDNVGIGTLSPAEKVTVHVAANTNIGITSLGGIPTLLAHNDAWNAWLDIGLGNNALVVKANGNVGIGTANPGYTLDVAGSFNATTFYCNTTLWCSDARYKKDISLLENALDNVLKMKGVSYFWKVKDFPDKNFTDAKQIGFIAQEVEKIYPELVNTNENGYKSVDYSKFTPILLEAIKEQQRIIDDLKLSVGQLSEENKALKASSEARITKLEAVVQTLLQAAKEEAKK